MEAIRNQVDQKIVNQLAKGSPKAFEAVMDCYFSAVYSTGKRRLGSARLAEDVATQVFASVWKRQIFENTTQLKEFIAASFSVEIMKMTKHVSRIVTYSSQE